MTAMPESSLEIVRRGVDAFNRGAFDEGFSFFDDEVVLDNQVSGSISGGTYLGREQVVAFFLEWGENFEPGSVIEIEEALERADQVAVCLRLRLRGLGSGVAVESRRWYVYSVRVERIARIAIYSDRERALAAAGITAGGEQSAPLAERGPPQGSIGSSESSATPRSLRAFSRCA